MSEVLLGAVFIVAGFVIPPVVILFDAKEKPGATNTGSETNNLEEVQNV